MNKVNKQCTKCGVTKPVNEFRYRNDRNGYRGECRQCERERQYRQNPEYKERMRQYMRQYDQNPERIIHQTLRNMWSRCCNPNNKDYKDYGGRGIRVADEFNYKIVGIERAAFDLVACIGYRPGEGYSIERINNDGNYEPGNVKWATHEEQANNRRKQKRNRERCKQITI